MTTTATVAGTRVEGEAKVGDRVTYHDMANQDGTIRVVTSTPDENRDPKWGWTQGYGLTSEDGTITTYSDLAQYGWTFAEQEPADHAYECPDCGGGHDGMTTGTELCEACTNP